VEIHAIAEEASLQATSTATVLLRPADLDGARARLRLYGVDDGGVYRALPAAREWGRLVAESPCGLRERAIAYLDAPRRFLAPFRFTIAGPEALTPTCIPGSRREVTWLVPGANGPAPATIDVTYKDVSVVRLPDASWLLVAARYRTPTSNPPRPATPGASLGDVVAWRAADPAFTEDLRGPYWLVDGQDALPGEARPAWLGVPGALVSGAGDGLHLDVYYVVEPGDDVGPPPAPAQRPSGVPDPAQKPDPNRPPDPSQKPDPNRAPDPAQKPAPGLSPGVALKRFEWAALSAVLSEPAPLESAWELTDAVPGALLGRVRVWSAAATPGAVRPFETAFPDGAPLRFADPAPFSCGSSPADLFLAAIPQPRSGGPNGHGVWHAAGIPTGATLCAVADAGPCDAIAAVAGLDFLIAPGGPASPSRLATSTATAFYVDPDPLRLPLGALHVAFGDIADGSEAGLLWARGTAKDVCRPWTEAWEE
jgi:hypothetical protein